MHSSGMIILFLAAAALNECLAEEPLTRLTKMLDEARTTLIARGDASAEVYEGLAYQCRADMDFWKTRSDSVNNEFTNMQAPIAAEASAVNTIETDITTITKQIQVHQNRLAHISKTRADEAAQHAREHKKRGEMVAALKKAKRFIEHRQNPAYAAVMTMITTFIENNEREQATAKTAWKSNEGTHLSNVRQRQGELEEARVLLQAKKDSLVARQGALSELYAEMQALAQEALEVFGKQKKVVSDCDTYGLQWNNEKSRRLAEITEISIVLNIFDELWPSASFAGVASDDSQAWMNDAGRYGNATAGAGGFLQKSKKTSLETIKESLANRWPSYAGDYEQPDLRSREPQMMQAAKRYASQLESKIKARESSKVWQESEKSLERRQKAIAFIASKGESMQSSLLSTLANSVSQNPYAKVVAMIQDLINRLLTMQSTEIGAAGDCKFQMELLYQKRDHGWNEAVSWLYSRRKAQLALEMLTRKKTSNSGVKTDLKTHYDEDIAKHNAHLSDLNAKVTYHLEMVDVIDKVSAVLSVHLANIQRGDNKKAAILNQVAEMIEKVRLDIASDEELWTGQVNQMGIKKQQLANGFNEADARLEVKISHLTSQISGRNTFLSNMDADTWSLASTTKEIHSMQCHTPNSPEQQIQQRAEEVKALKQALTVLSSGVYAA